MKGCVAAQELEDKTVQQLASEKEKVRGQSTVHQIARRGQCHCHGTSCATLPANNFHQS